MIDPLRMEILELLGKILEHSPEYRVGQVICNAEMFMVDGLWQSVGNLDDERLLDALRNQWRQIEEREEELVGSEFALAH